MKKVLTLALAFAMLLTSVFAFSSCGETSTFVKNSADEAKAYNNYYDQVEAPTKNTDGTLVVATSPDFAPMEFYDAATNQVVGFDILLANYIAKELNMSLEIKPMSFDAVQTAVQSGKADLGMSGFSWTSARAETFNISDGYEAGEAASDQVVVTLKTKEGQYTTAESFNGLKVGAQATSLQYMLATEQLTGATVQEFTSIDTMVESLKTGKIDAIALENGNATAVLAANTDLAQSGFKFEVADQYKYNVILINKSNNDLLTKVNEVLAKAKKEGIFNDWYKACEVYAGVSTVDEAGFDENGNKITVEETK